MMVVAVRMMENDGKRRKIRAQKKYIYFRISPLSDVRHLIFLQDRVYRCVCRLFLAQTQIDVQKRLIVLVLLL